ncbi:F-box/LRR-repeat protein At2g42720-like isoform X2 [Silene latifolia]
MERMTSCDSKKILRIENLDRISELPEPIILHILSYLPLEDSGRASILSKTWKNFCSLYPILHFDHNLFALQSLVSSKEGCGPHVYLIRDMFLDYVDCHLTRVSQLDSPIRKLSLTVVINDSLYYSRVDKWLEFVKQMNVEDLCIFVQIVDFWWPVRASAGNALYKFPFSLLASKSLRSVYIRGCMLGHETFASEVSFSSLQRLCLSHVSIGENVMETLATRCQGIEILVLDNCAIRPNVLELSKFPKLKKALIEIEDGWIDCVDITNTNLECFKCDAESECHIGPNDCARIREFTLVDCIVNHPNLFKDLTATFPLIEEIEVVDIRDTDTLNATSNVLKKLKFVSLGPICVEQVYIDCPSLTLLDFTTYGMTNLYVDCPKLRVFRYEGDTVPERLFIRSVADLEESSCSISTYGAYDESWFFQLRVFLELIMASSTNVSLLFSLPMETFKPEEVKSVQASPQYDVNLSLNLINPSMQNVAALVDAVLWIIRPTTLTVNYRTYYLVEYLCENLVKKSQDKIGGEQIHQPCWLHQIEDFQVETSLDISDIKQNLASLPGQCRAIANRGDHGASRNKICFKFHWCYKLEKTTI